MRTNEGILFLGKEEVLFFEGEPGDFMYIVRKGAIGIYSDYKKPGERLLVRLGPEDTFGEMSLLEAMPRSATAVALEDDTRVTKISWDNFVSYFEERPARVKKFMMQMSQRLRDLTNDYMEACKLADTLLAREAARREQADCAKPDGMGTERAAETGKQPRGGRLTGLLQKLIDSRADA